MSFADKPRGDAYNKKYGGICYQKGGKGTRK